MAIEYKVLILTAVTLLNLLLGFFVFIKNRKSLLNIFYGLFAVGLAYWSLGMMMYIKEPIELDRIWTWSLILHFAGSFIAVNLLCFSIVFPSGRINKFLAFLLYLPLILIFLMLFIYKSIIIDLVIKPGNRILVYGPGYIFYFLHFFVYIVSSIVVLFRKYLKAEGSTRVQLKYIILAILIPSTFASVINMVLPARGDFRIAWTGPIFLLFIVIFVGYAVLKRHLMNIKLIATELLVGLVSLLLLIDLLLSESLPVILLKLGVFVAFVYLGISLIRSVLKEIEYRERVKRAYDLEKKARKQIEELTEAKTQFIMATQHHFRTPLTSMKGYLDLLFGGTYGKVPQKIKETLLKFQASTSRLIRIVNELLDISQFQLGKKVVSLQPGIQIEPILKEIIEELQFETKAKGIYLKLEKPAKIPLIKADVEKLKVALFNIVDNALKYTRKGGITINVKCQMSNVKRREESLLIAIKDTGIGIPKEELKNLFARVFERGEGAKEVHGMGRGIGLYIAGHIIKAHQGKIWAESAGKSKGSTFFIELPVG